MDRTDWGPENMAGDRVGGAAASSCLGRQRSRSPFIHRHEAAECLLSMRMDKAIGFKAELISVYQENQIQRVPNATAASDAAERPNFNTHLLPAPRRPRAYSKSPSFIQFLNSSPDPFHAPSAE